MSRHNTDLIKNDILRRDPEQKIVAINDLEKTITYASGIRCYQTPHYEPEGFIRAHLVLRLIQDLGYPAECIELENDISVRVGRTKKQRGRESGRSDVLVFRKSEDGESLFLAIECKRSDEMIAARNDLDGQLWGITKSEKIEKRVGKGVNYLCLYTADVIGGELYDNCLVIDFTEYPTHAIWQQRGEPYADVVPRSYGSPLKSRYANVVNLDPETGYRPLVRAYDRRDFERLRNRLHNLLWAGASTDDNNVFYQLTKLLLVKIYDELFTAPEKAYSVQIQFDNDAFESPLDLFRRLEPRYRTACRELLNYDDEKIAQFPFLVEGFTHKKLYIAVMEIQSISFSENELSDGYDVLGSFFEGILRNQRYFKQSTGTFFTHQTIVRFVLAMVRLDETTIACLNEPKPRLPFLIDPSTGSGTFLIEAMRFVTSRVNARRQDLRLNEMLKRFLNAQFGQPGRPNEWAQLYIYGIEPRPQLGLAAKVNMILHGDGSMNIFIDDALHPFHNDNSEAHYKRNHPTGLGQFRRQITATAV